MRNVIILALSLIIVYQCYLINRAHKVTKGYEDLCHRWSAEYDTLSLYVDKQHKQIDLLININNNCKTNP
jgi:hypothetical protein